ncbi:hypothetical protein BC831DRAFT_470991 [Entophlyctis helioformis]|nr:hypothetical protein BC831DRAFT_470991 [Entophlyctis helioformis]
MPPHYYQQSHEQQSHPSQHRQHHATHTQQQQSTHQAPNRSLLVDLPDPSSRMHASATSSESLPAASTMHHHVHDQPSGHSSASATSLLGPQRVLSWSQPSTTSAQHHATLSALGHSGAHPSIDTDPSSFFLGGSAQLFSSLIQPPIIDPFPSIFPGTFIPTPSLSNLALFESSMMQQNSLQAVEDHLLMLGLTYNQVVPLATQHSLDLLSPPQRSLASIPRALQDALIAMGVFFSTHTDLFSSMLDQQGLSSAPSVSSPSSPPGSANAARIRIARIYILRARKALNAHVAPPGSTHLTSSSDAADGLADEPLDDCDAVRIMLLLATICYGLGDGGDSMQLIADAYRLAQKSRIYESSLPPTKASLQPPLTVDALVVSVPRMIGKKPTPRKLTPTEKFDRRVLWGSCLIVDTYCAMASGYQLGIDEGDYPHLVAGYNFSDLLPHISRLSSQQRLSASDLAEHTLWENSPLAVMFDDVSEMSLTSMASNLFTGEFESEVQLTVIMRRILRYVRSREASLSVAFSSSHFDRFPENLRAIYSTMQQSDDTASLHDSLLAWYSHYPARYCAFPSLEVFAIGVHQSSLDKFRDWAYNLYVVESILTFLSAFSYLHLPLISSPDADRKMYRLSCPPHASASASGTPGDDHQLHGDGTAGSANVSTASGHGGKRAQGQFRANGDAPISANTPIGGEEHLWSSRQVLLACFRALTYMIQRLYTPTTPLQSPFQAGVYEGERLAFCQRQPLSIDTPSPALCWTIHSVNVYIVSSAALMAVRSNSSSSNSGPGSGGGSGGISANAGIGIQPAPTGTGRVSDEEQLQSSQYEAVTRLIKTLVLPSLERIGKVWPMAQLYQFKLATLLKGGTAEEWAKEAKTYTL